MARSVWLPFLVNDALDVEWFEVPIMCEDVLWRTLSDMEKIGVMKHEAAHFMVQKDILKFNMCLFSQGRFPNG